MSNGHIQRQDKVSSTMCVGMKHHEPSHIFRYVCKHTYYKSHVYTYMYCKPL